MNAGKDTRKRSKRPNCAAKRGSYDHGAASREAHICAQVLLRYTTNLKGLCPEVSRNCLRRIAECTTMPAGMLRQLAMHLDPSVREAVGDNLAAPIDVLWILSEDDSVDVRYAMAENHNLPDAILSALAADDNPYVACRARETLDRLVGCQIVRPDFGRRLEERVAG